MRVFSAPAGALCYCIRVFLRVRASYAYMATARMPLLAANGKARSDDLEAAGVQPGAGCDLVLVHPAEQYAPKTLGAQLIEIFCGCEAKGVEESVDVLSRRRALHARMRCVGLSLVFDTSRDGDETLVKVLAPEAQLEQMAERLQLEKKLKGGAGYARFSVAHKGRFEPAAEPSGLGSEPFFTSLERIRLLMAILEADKEHGGCGLVLEHEVEKGVLTAVVPIHNRRVTKELMRSWCTAPFWRPQPLDAIRDYYGESLAIYFAFAGHLTNALAWPTALGAIVYAASYYYGTMDNPFCPLYSVFCLLWTTWICKTWSREQARLALKWKVEDFEETERARTAFVGPLAHGFYSPEGHFVDVPETEALESSLPLVQKARQRAGNRRRPGDSSCPPRLHR